MPTLRKIAKKFLSTTLEDLVLLIHSPINEKRLLALIILTQQYKVSADHQKEELYQFYTAHIRHINNWNLVDASAHLIVGAHLWDKDRGMLEELALSRILWERRISIVATWHFICQNDVAWTREEVVVKTISHFATNSSTESYTKSPIAAALSVLRA